MKEFLRRIVTHGYLREHTVEDPRIASLIQIAENTKGPFRGNEEYYKLLLEQFQKADDPFNISREHTGYNEKYNALKHNWFSKFAYQFHAIEELGKLHNNQALDYLYYLSTENVQEFLEAVGSLGSMDGSGGFVRRVEQHFYPNARGKLKHGLNYTISLGDSWYDPAPFHFSEHDAGLPVRGPEWVHRSPTHQMLKKAIATLEQDLASS